MRRSEGRLLGHRVCHRGPSARPGRGRIVIAWDAPRRSPSALASCCSP
jgi:hypothetical protein